MSSEILLWWKSVLVMRWHTTVVESLSFRRLKSFICVFCWSCSSSGWAEWVDVQSAGTPGIWGTWAIRVQALRSSKGSFVRCSSVWGRSKLNTTKKVCWGTPSFCKIMYQVYSRNNSSGKERAVRIISKSSGTLMKTLSRDTRRSIIPCRTAPRINLLHLKTYLIHLKHYLLIQ